MSWVGVPGDWRWLLCRARFVREEGMGVSGLRLGWGCVCWLRA